MNTENTLPVDRYLAQRRYSNSQVSEIRDWAAKLPTLSDEDFVREAAGMIYLSAYAANNPRSAYHPMCDLCYDEAVRRGNSKLYSQAHKQAMRQAGY